MKQEIRIIGGHFRGKKITFPEAEGLRPTPDRIKETLFNWLMNDIKGAQCLDAFAGSGSLGLEAFSRGAKAVFFVEQSLSTYKHLQKNLQAFETTALHLSHMDVRLFLKQTRQQFDVIFLDPPFQSDMLEQCLSIIEHSTVLAPQGLLYIESGQSLVLNPTFWKTMRVKRAGQVHYSLSVFIKEPD